MNGGDDTVEGDGWEAFNGFEGLGRSVAGGVGAFCGDLVEAWVEGFGDGMQGPALDVARSRLRGVVEAGDAAEDCADGEDCWANLDGFLDVCRWNDLEVGETCDLVVGTRGAAHQVAVCNAV